MRVQLCCMVGLVGLIAAVSVPQPAPAEEVNKVVRALDRILNPEDARRYEERAHREHRAEEEHYWHDYRAGLETQHRESHEIRAEDARRYEAAARRNHKAEEEHYWRDYRLGLH